MSRHTAFLGLAVAALSLGSYGEPRDGSAASRSLWLAWLLGVRFLPHLPGTQWLWRGSTE